MVKTLLTNEYDLLTWSFVLKPNLNQTFSYGRLSRSGWKIFVCTAQSTLTKHSVKIAIQGCAGSSMPEFNQDLLIQLHRHDRVRHSVGTGSQRKADFLQFILHFLNSEQF